MSGVWGHYYSNFITSNPPLVILGRWTRGSRSPSPDILLKAKIRVSYSPMMMVQVKHSAQVCPHHSSIITNRIIQALALHRWLINMHKNIRALVPMDTSHQGFRRRPSMCLNKRVYSIEFPAGILLPKYLEERAYSISAVSSPESGCGVG